MSNDQAVINVQYNTALTEQQAADIALATAIDKALWAVKLGLAPFPDGDHWCVLWGADLQSGVAAFGKTPIEAIRQFDVEMLNARLPAGKRADHVQD